MRQMVNGRVVELSTNADGSINSDALRRAAGIPNNRTFIMQLPNGGNRVINPGESVKIKPEQYFTDAPRHDRGQSSDQRSPNPLSPQGAWQALARGCGSAVRRQVSLQ